MSDEYKNAEQEAHKRGQDLIHQWDQTIKEIEQKWGLPEDKNLNDYKLEFRKLTIPIVVSF